MEALGLPAYGSVRMGIKAGKTRSPFPSTLDYGAPGTEEYVLIIITPGPSPPNRSLQTKHSTHELVVAG